jgi:hypothetical protein
MASAEPDGALVLVSTQSQRVLCRLTPPATDRIFDFAAAPDGSRIAVLGYDADHLAVWDVGLIRQELSDLGLDWDELPQVPAQDRPLRIKLISAIAPASESRGVPATK